MDDRITPAVAQKRQEFYGRIGQKALAPLWESLKGLVPRAPATKFLPHAWHYGDVRPLLMESGGLLTAEEAERRVLVFENPGQPGTSRITATMYAGMQLILPGEVAPAHKHTASALRFVLESNGGYTSVAGERTTMRRGDFIITPNDAWHDHGQDQSTGPVIWVDGLDLHIVNFFEAAFSEHLNDKKQMVVKREGDSIARFGSGMMPFNATSPFGKTTPIFNYTYETSRRALMQVAGADAPDPHFGHALRYANPFDGGWPMPLIAAWLTHLPKGFETKPVRSTDGQTWIVVEGEVTAEVEGKTFTLGENDLLAVPSWCWRKFRASKDAVVFAFSDRSAQEKLSIFSEERR